MEKAAEVDLTTRIKESVSKAQDYLFSQQAEEGYWQGDLVTNPSIEAEHVMLTEFLGVKDQARWEKIGNYLRRLQLSDGSWNNSRGSEGDLSTTVECYFALKLIGDSPEEEHMEKAAKFVREKGGVSSSRVFTRIWLSLFGLWDWDQVPAMPPELIYLPSWFPMNIYDFASWARCTIVPLLVVIAERPVHQVPEEKQIPELFVQEEGERTINVGYDLFSWEGFFYLMDHLLTLYNKLPWNPGREKAKEKCLDWILDRQENDGSWGGIQPPWVYSLIALYISGYSLDHPVMEQGLEGFDSFARESSDEWWLQACVSPVWDTAWALLALEESGVDSNHPRLKKARDWLLDQEVRAKGDWTVNAPEVDLGGWPFEFENENYPDIDDVAVVLMALDENSGTQRDTSQAIDRGFEWLLAMQSSNGGWGAYDVDNDREILYEIPFADFGAMIDPPSVDVTAHVMELIGRFGFTTDHHLVEEPLQYLKDEQQEDGSWFGRWGVNYVYGTGSVLPALEAIGEDMGRPYVQRAAEWLISCQNEDGGWGEVPESYDNPGLAGQGPSTPSQTAWALLGLISADKADHPATRQGLQYLAKTQTDEGTWNEDFHTGTGFPGDFYLIYELYSHYFPLLAFARYREKKKDEGIETK